MAKPLRFYPIDSYISDRPAPPAFKCEQCGYLSRAGTTPLCEVCAQGSPAQRSAGHGHEPVDE